jgi:tetratricopeptide (TPR) repeat protein
MAILFKRLAGIFACYLCLTGLSLGQEESGPDATKVQSPSRSERDQEARESSSRDTRIDLSPPKDDLKNHPNSAESVSDALGDTSGEVREFHPWNPHKAMKDIEVGDFYFKKKNYRAALDRYREALVYKPNDAISNFRMGQCLEKLNHPEEARVHYQEYLKILPHGPLAEEAQKALEKLRTEASRAQDGEPPKN